MNDNGTYEFKHENADTLVNDYIEQAFSAVLFAYLAAEAFANSIIPDNYCYTQTLPKHTITMNKAQIERHLSLIDKYTKVIPDIYSISSPKSQDFWEHFMHLEKSRNEITHYKSDGLDYQKPVAPFLRRFFVDFVKRDTIPSCRKLISWIAESIPDQLSIPREFRNEAFKEDNSAGLLES